MKISEIVVAHILNEVHGELKLIVITIIVRYTQVECFTDI